jgi:hypothetical protein
MDELDKTLQDMQLQSDEDWDKRIERAVNRRIRNIALRTVLAVLLALAVIFLCISPVMKNTHCKTVQARKLLKIQLFERAFIHWGTSV